MNEELINQKLDAILEMLKCITEGLMCQNKAIRESFNKIHDTKIINLTKTEN